MEEVGKIVMKKTFINPMAAKRILTGDRPTGKLHYGHYVGSLQNRVRLQSTYDQFIMIADVQALTDNYERPEKVREHIFELLLDYLAVGIDPTQSTIFVQSLIPELFELTVYFLNLVTLNRLKHNPTVKNEMKEKGIEESVTAGFMCYPVSQAADILLFLAEVVPVGADQLPMLEQTHEIARRFNALYHTNLFSEPKAELSNQSRLPGFDGKAKMSKSLGNSIALSATKEEIEEAVKKMYTDPNHLKVSDPGQVEGNIVFTYLDAFDPDTGKVQELKEHYSRGGLGDMTIKRYLMEVLERHFAPIRQKRQELSLRPKDLSDILFDGTSRAQKEGRVVIEQVREAMKINYQKLFNC